jgi:septum formation protein
VAPVIPVFLASASPRRQELLTQVGIAWEPLLVQVDEAPGNREFPADYVTRLALAKAVAGRARQPRPGVVLAGDTAVVCAGQTFGKPLDEADAHRMLRALSGRAHEVYTAVAVASERGEATAVSCSEVTFRDLADAEIAAYWRTGEPRDKAGAYGIQGRGAVFVADLRGSYSGVMGLPLYETAQLLAGVGITPWGRLP